MRPDAPVPTDRDNAVVNIHAALSCAMPVPIRRDKRANRRCGTPASYLECRVMPPLSVLLVEDDAKFRDAFAQAFATVTDMRLVAALGDGASALQWLARESPDVMLVDLGLPDVDGLTLIVECARRHPKCEIMVITVFGDERHVVDALAAGATGYLLKEALPRDFLEPIRALRAGGSPISPIIARRLLARLVAPTPAPPPAVAPKADDVPSLSTRELATLELISKGFDYDEIAGLQSISRQTVLTYVKRIFRKLQVRSKTEAVYEARLLGLVRD